MAVEQKQNARHIRQLEQALAAQYGWQANAAWRDALIAEVRRKAARLRMDEERYCHTAINSHPELQHLAEHITNNETRFFRDPEQFHTLRRQILPQLIELRAAERRLHVWSAACSTGEEAYSLAILLHEALPVTEKWKVVILATDLRGQAILAATKGHYSSSSLSLVPPQQREKYFTLAGVNGREAMFDVNPEMKGFVAFRRANLYEANFWKSLHQPFDLILCNNLFLYFHPLAVKQTVDRMANVLRRDGRLAVMGNEADYVNHPGLKREMTLRGSFFKKL